jgi:hypothetical protein
MSLSAKISTSLSSAGPINIFSCFHQDPSNPCGQNREQYHIAQQASIYLSATFHTEQQNREPHPFPLNVHVSFLSLSESIKM